MGGGGLRQKLESSIKGPTILLTKVWSNLLAELKAEEASVSHLSEKNRTTGGRDKREQKEGKQVKERRRRGREKGRGREKKEEEGEREESGREGRKWVGKEASKLKASTFSQLR